jgi:predicted RNA-binding protein with PUA-like domain
MAFWIFKCDPNRYLLEDRLADQNTKITWTVSRFRDEIGHGDTVFLWVTGNERGIRAVIRVDEAPRLMAELESEQAYLKEHDTEERLRVVGTLTHRDVNLRLDELRKVKGLEQLSVFKGVKQGTNFPVTADQGAILLRLITER